MSEQNDTIYRQDAIAEIDRWVQAFKETRHMQSASDAPFIKCGIAELPPAQPQRMQGKWIDSPRKWEKHPICDKCGKKLTDFFWNFCPNCGADMREVEHGAENT